MLSAQPYAPIFIGDKSRRRNGNIHVYLSLFSAKDEDREVKEKLYYEKPHCVLGGNFRRKQQQKRYGVVIDFLKLSPTFWESLLNENKTKHKGIKTDSPKHYNLVFIAILDLPDSSSQDLLKFVNWQFSASLLTLLKAQSIFIC